MDGKYRSNESSKIVRISSTQDSRLSNVTIPPSNIATYDLSLPTVSGYIPVGLVSHAIWDAPNTTGGYAFANVGNHYIESNKLYVSFYNSHDTATIYVRPILFVLYVRNS